MNRIRKKYLMIISLPLTVGLLTGCSHIVSATDTQTSNTRPNGSLETIYAAEIRQGKIWFLVKSTGCTSEKSFELEVRQDSDKQLSASLLRQKPDYCKAMPRYIAVELDSPKLLKERLNVVINNPFAQKSLAKGKNYKKTT
jgi:hypothetical protein